MSYLPQDTQQVTGGGGGEQSGCTAAALNPFPGCTGANPELVPPRPHVFFLPLQVACPGITLWEMQRVGPLLDLTLNYTQCFIPAH